VNVGGDHSRTGAYLNANAAGAPHVANRIARTVVAPDAFRQAVAPDASRQAVAPDASRQAVAPEPRRASDADEGSADEDAGGSRQRPLVPSARPGTDDHLATKAGGIDDPLFRDYVRSRSRALLRTAYLLTGNVADAEDLVQSALAKTYLAWDRIEDRGALDGYVRRAMVNTHISWWRRRRLEEFPTDEIPDQAVVDHSVTSDLQEALRRAVDRLPQRMRAAVMLRYFDDMTEAEVAEALGVSLGTVKSTVSRAVAKLRIDADLQPG
jgi:RNA polymerase sigma-70 factor (sigma-E family)